MNRRSFFSLLAAPVVAPMVPKIPKDDPTGIIFTGDCTVSNCTVSTAPLETLTFTFGDELMVSDGAARAIIDAINKEVKRGSVSLTATDVKR